jgi:LytS/YehU family sensor histidine kinase
MRYSLNQGDSMGMVPVIVEIENLENYIGIQEMRFKESLQLQYEKSFAKDTQYKILPHLLITMVENAFKHGNNSKPYFPLQIRISLIDSRLSVSVKNLINKVQLESLSTKTGLKNMANRLQLVYKNRQKFLTYNNDKIFAVGMIIELDESKTLPAIDDSLNELEKFTTQHSNFDFFNKVAIL